MSRPAIIPNVAAAMKIQSPAICSQIRNGRRAGSAPPSAVATEPDCSPRSAAAAR
jgi:hypothetical protein